MIAKRWDLLSTLEGASRQSLAVWVHNAGSSGTTLTDAPSKTQRRVPNA
jgi:hypothetical protein